MLRPGASRAWGLVGRQLSVPPAGSPLAEQVALVAAARPMLVQVTVATTAVPGATFKPTPTRFTAMSWLAAKPGSHRPTVSKNQARTRAKRC